MKQLEIAKQPARGNRNEKAASKSSEQQWDGSNCDCDSSSFLRHELTLAVVVNCNELAAYDLTRTKMKTKTVDVS